MMLTKKLACPSCQAHLKVADSLPAGKLIRCPKCQQPFPVPDEDDDTGTEPPQVAAPKRRAAPPPEDDEAPEEPPKPRSGSKKKRRKRRKETRSSTPLILGLAIGGVVLAAAVAGVLVFVFKSPADKNGSVAQNSSPPSLQASSGPGIEQPGGRRSRGRPGRAESGPEGETPPSSAPSGPAAGNSDGGQVAQAQPLFQQHCARCHNAGDNGGGGGRRMGRGPDLSHVGSKRDASWLMDHIRNPKTHNPMSRMPEFEGKLSEDALRSLAEYLASLK